MRPDQIAGKDIQGNPATLDTDRLRWRPGAYALVIRDDQILVLDNLLTKQYDLPGGGIDIWEPIETALQRELMEECHITADIGNMIYMDEQFFLTPSGNHWHTLRFYYRATMTGGTLQSTTIEEEFSVNPHWVAIDSLRADNIAVDWGAVQHFQQNYS
ncbi:MAG: NUDIX domain-containing protein [Chloroflexota bacterium]